MGTSADRDGNASTLDMSMLVSDLRMLCEAPRSWEREQDSK